MLTERCCCCCSSSCCCCSSVGALSSGVTFPPDLERVARANDSERDQKPVPATTTTVPEVDEDPEEEEEEEEVHVREMRQDGQIGRLRHRQWRKHGKRDGTSG